MEEQKRVFDVPGAAVELGNISPAMVRKLIHQSHLGHHRIGDRILISREDIDEYLRKTRVAPKDEELATA